MDIVWTSPNIILRKHRRPPQSCTFHDLHLAELWKFMKPIRLVSHCILFSYYWFRYIEDNVQLKVWGWIFISNFWKVFYINCMLMNLDVYDLFYEYDSVECVIEISNWGVASWVTGDLRDSMMLSEGHSSATLGAIRHHYTSLELISTCKSYFYTTGTKRLWLGQLGLSIHTFCVCVSCFFPFLFLL